MSEVPPLQPSLASVLLGGFGSDNALRMEQLPHTQTPWRNVSSADPRLSAGLPSASRVHCGRRCGTIPLFPLPMPWLSVAVGVVRCP